MHRTQILLEEWQYDALRSQAERTGTSLSEMIREAVSLYVARRGKQKRAGLLGFKGVGQDAEVSGRDHDRILYQEFAGAQPGTE